MAARLVPFLPHLHWSSPASLQGLPSGSRPLARGIGLDPQYSGRPRPKPTLSLSHVEKKKATLLSGPQVPTAITGVELLEVRPRNIAQSLQTPTNGVARRRDAKLYVQHIKMGSYPS